MHSKEAARHAAFSAVLSRAVDRVDFEPILAVVRHQAEEGAFEEIGTVPDDATAGDGGIDMGQLGDGGGGKGASDKVHGGGMPKGWRRETGGIPQGWLRGAGHARG